MASVQVFIERAEFRSDGNIWFSPRRLHAEVARRVQEHPAACRPLALRDGRLYYFEDGAPVKPYARILIRHRKGFSK